MEKGYHKTEPDNRETGSPEVCENAAKNLRVKNNYQSFGMSDNIKNSPLIGSEISNSFEKLIGNLEEKLGQDSNEKFTKIQSIVNAIQLDQKANYELIVNVAKENNETLIEIKRILKEMQTDSKAQESKIQILEKEILDREKKLVLISSSIEKLKSSNNSPSQKQPYPGKASLIPPINQRDPTPKKDPRAVNSDESLFPCISQLNSLLASKIEKEFEILKVLMESNIKLSEEIKKNVQNDDQLIKNTCNDTCEILNFIESKTKKIEKDIESSMISFKKFIEDIIKQNCLSNTSGRVMEEVISHNSPTSTIQINRSDGNTESISKGPINDNQHYILRFNEDYRAFEQILEDFNIFK